MANSYLLDININSTLQDVIRKVNANFKLVSKNQTQQTKSDVRQEATRVDSVIAGAVGEINTAVDNGIKDIDKELNEANKALTNKFDELIEAMEKSGALQAVGTCIACDYDPNEQWPGTTWTKLDEIDAIEATLWKRVK